MASNSSVIAIGVVIEDEICYPHQWTEVHLDGHWEPCDPTGSLDYSNAAWIKIVDSSMKDVLDSDSFVECERVWSRRMTVKVVKAE